MLHCKEFEGWVGHKLATTSNSWFRFGLNFVKMASDYKLLREGIRFGSSIILESDLNRFTQVWCLIGKTKCLEMGLTLMEELYRNKPFWLLQVYRDNRSAKLFDGNCLDGTETLERALDELMEIIQHKYKSIAFSNTNASWIHHSFNMPYVQQCTTFVENEYWRRAAVKSMEEYNSISGAEGTHTDSGNRRKKTVQSKRTVEKIWLDELLTITSIFHKDSSRTEFDPDLVWNALLQLTTKLSTGGTATNDDIDESMGDTEERRLSVVVDAIQERKEVLGHDNDDSNADEVELRENAADEEEHLKSLEYDSDDEGMVAVGEIQVSGQKKALKNMTKVSVHKIALENIYMVGKPKFMDMNLPAIRLRRKVREIRESKALHDNLYVFMEDLGGDFTAVFDYADQEQEATGLSRRHKLASDLTKLNH
jgi:hypothetical protein